MTATAEFVYGDPECQYRHLTANVAKSVDPDAAIDVACFMTTDTPDGDSEVMLPDGADLSRFVKNPVVMLCHAMGQPGCYYPLPIGKTEWTKQRPRGILAGVRFTEKTPMGREVKALFDDDMLRSFSIGFKPIEQSLMTRQEADSRPDWKAAFDATRGRINMHRKWQLLELSVAPVPSNPDALRVNYKAKGILLPKWLELPTPETPPMTDATTSAALGGAVETKTIVDGAWDAGAARARIARWASSDGSGDKDTIDWEKFGRAFLYHDGSDKEAMGGYKFPIADIRDGKFVIVREAIRAAASRLDGADIPEADKAKIRAAIARHEKEAGIGESESEGEKSHKCPGKDCPEHKDMEDGDGPDMETMSLKPGDHVQCKGMGCGEVKSLHYDGEHDGPDGEPLTATKNAPVARVDMHDEKCKCMGTVKCFPMGSLKPHAGKKAMSENSGSSGGYGVDDDEPEDGNDTADTEDNDEDMEEDDLDDENDDEAKGFKAGMHVKIKAPHYKGVGVVKGTYTRGHVPNVDEDIKATDDEPAARVQAHKKFGDGHVPTADHVGVLCKHLSPLPEPLKAPSKKSTVAAAPVRKTAKLPPLPTKELPPLAGVTPEEKLQRAVANLAKTLDPANLQKITATMTDQAINRRLGKLTT